MQVTIHLPAGRQRHSPTLLVSKKENKKKKVLVTNILNAQNNGKVIENP